MLELGRAIVRQLELGRSASVASIWMAHHLAELIKVAETAQGEDLQLAQDRAADLILRLWAGRHALPGIADPLHGHRAAIKVLGAMLPSSSPWHRYHRGGQDDAVLGEIFIALSQIVMNGVLLTRGGETRRIEEAEWSALSEEERFLADILTRWKGLVARPAPEPISLEAFYAVFAESDDEIMDETPVVDKGEDAGDAPDPEREMRAAILDNLDTIQAHLADLIEKWKASGGPDDPAISADNDALGT